MPIEIDDTNIIINDGSTTSNILEVVKSKGTRYGDEIPNVPTINNKQLYKHQSRPITEYTVLDADSSYLIAHYKFDDNTNVGLDSSSNGNNLTARDGTVEIVSTNSVFGSSSYYTSDSLETNSFTFHNKAFSISVWAYYTGAGNIISQHKNATLNQSLHCQVLTSNSSYIYKLGFFANDLNSPEYNDSNKWVHLVYQIHLDGTREIWRNGVKIASDTTAFLDLSGSYNVIVGDWLRPSASTRYYNGYLDDLRIYNKALTAQEIDILANIKVKTYIEPRDVLTYTEERMYPPVRNFTSNQHTISYEIYGNGTYETSASSEHPTLKAYTAFTGKSHLAGWHTAGLYYNGSGEYNIGSVSPESFDGGIYNGEWLKIKLPVKIKLTKYAIEQRYGSSTVEERAPGEFKIYGSNDDINWIELVNKNDRTKISYTKYLYEEKVDIFELYQYYVIVVNKLYGNQQEINLNEWYIYGREQYTSSNPEYKYLTFSYDSNLIDYPILSSDSTNLIAHYKFDEVYQTNKFKDETTNAYHLEYASGTTAQVTNSNYIIGNSSYKVGGEKLIIGNDFTLSTYPTITLSVWTNFNKINQSPSEDWTSLFDTRGTGGDRGIWVLIRNSNDGDNGKMYVYFYYGGTSIYKYKQYQATNGVYNDGTWRLLTFVLTNISGTQYNFTLYENGMQKTPITETVVDNVFDMTSSSEPFIIGEEAGTAYDYVGYLDDFRIYNKALTDTEVFDLYNQYYQAKYQLNFSNDTECDILIVGGGGAGGNSMGGGGGAGGVVYTVGQTLSAGTYTIGVGSGGTGIALTSAGQGTIGIEQDGKDSSIKDSNGNYIQMNMGGINQYLKSIGGGGGGIYYNPVYVNGRNGGSGGGSSETNDNGWIVNQGGLALQPKTLWNGITYITGGKNGRVNTTTSNDYKGGGGGGAGEEAINYNDGTYGILINITGNNEYYAAGGGAGQYSVNYLTTDGLGGSGIGGNGRIYNGSTYLREATSGLDGTGSGGGGGSYVQDPDNVVGSGGSGIVIIRYKINYDMITYNAQWTYSSSDASVYHLGNVGIGTEASSTHSLSISGDTNIDGDVHINDAKINIGLNSNYYHENEPVVYNDNIRTLPVYDNRTDSLQKAAEEVSGVKGWRIVRFLPGTATSWHPVNDSLLGTTTYGTAYDYSNAFSVEFGEFDEFMFSNGNMRNWLHATRDQVIGQPYDNAQRTIIKSSKSNTSYKARWYNRSAGHDPLITVEDWSVSSVGDKHGLLYIEDTHNGHAEYFGNSNGMCVFVRKSTDTISSVTTDYTHKYLFFNYNNYYESTFSYYTVHNINFPVDTQCDVLVVGGGGSGGGDQGGGGGAGGLVYLENVTLNGDYSLVVGKGGAQASATNTNNGYSSYFNKSRLSTYEDDNFEDYANGTIYGELNNIGNNTYYITLSNGIETRLTGWTYTRNHASGFLRNINGDAFLTAYNLKPGATYDFATYNNSTNASYHQDSYFNVNGGSTITVKQRSRAQPVQPTYVGHAVADSNGEIIFKFWRPTNTGHIEFSGISISLNEGKYTAIYGGGGGRYNGASDTSSHYGLDGGSGGGAGLGNTFSIIPEGGDSIQDQYLDSQGNRRGWGNPGGNGIANSYSGGYVSAGGGGAGAAGGDVINTTTAGDGGDGKEIDITGVMTYYAGGGGGGSYNDSGAYGGEGGLGGGGHGGSKSSLYVASSTINKYKDGLPHTGSGGGGVREGGQYSGAGGSGVIIIRYAVGNRINTLSSWKYNSQFDDVYLMGNVGINNNNPIIPLEINGDIIATSKSFKIEHPIVSNMLLYHGCVEGPRYDNIYRGKKLIVNGYGEVNIDRECNNTGGMTPGTFKELNDNPQLYLQNNQTFDKVRGYIENGKIKIYCINTTQNVIVDWLVIGERRDKDVIKSSITNASGKLICEQ